MAKGYEPALGLSDLGLLSGRIPPLREPLFSLHQLISWVAALGWSYAHLQRRRFPAKADGLVFLFRWNLFLDRVNQRCFFADINRTVPRRF